MCDIKPPNRYVLRCLIPHQERAAFILPQTGWDDLWKTTERARGQNPWGVRRDTDYKACRYVFSFFNAIENNLYWVIHNGCQKMFIFPTEQYDAFVKFTHDQLMRRFGEQPASCEYIYYCFALIDNWWSLPNLPLWVCHIGDKLENVSIVSAAKNVRDII